MTDVSIDAGLAWLHHLGAFALVAVLFAEWCLAGSPRLDRDGLQRLARLDLFYGALAVAMLLAGLARLLWGARGWSFHADNPVFWLKLGLFALIGLLSVVPTLRLLRWRRSAELPAAGELRALRRWMSAELLLLPALLACASLMARGIGH